VLRRGAPRDDARQAHQAVGDRARPRPVRVRRPGRAAARGRPAATGGAANGGARRAGVPARGAPRPVCPPGASGGGHRRDPHRVHRTGAQARSSRPAADEGSRRTRHRVPTGPHALRHRRPRRPRRAARSVGGGARRPGPDGARRPVRPGGVDPGRRTRPARRRGPRVPAHRWRTGPATTQPRLAG
jgi:hypothetical protein